MLREECLFHHIYVMAQNIAMVSCMAEVVDTRKVKTTQHQCSTKGMPLRDSMYCLIWLWRSYGQWHCYGKTWLQRVDLGAKGLWCNG